MVLCELMDLAPSSFFFVWGLLTVLTLMSVAMFSGTVFLRYYVWPTYDLWQYKINPKFPSARDVRLEIIQTIKGSAAGCLAPSLSLYLTQQGKSQAYCGVGEHGWVYLLLSFPVCWLLSDLFEFLYHYAGHRFTFMWTVHKHHHRFFNPSPFAVIADEPPDQLVRALPMLFFPLLAPVNIEMLFVMFGFFFYSYGVYLHWGYELSWPDAHHPWINTSFQHFAHHAVSVMNKPYHTGFYVKLWDNIAGSVLPEGKCFCSKCARAKGERSFEAWQKVEKPDYSPLLSARFWIYGGSEQYGKKA